MKKYVIILVSAILLGSCQDFLKEEMVETITQDYFDTEKGLTELVTSTYNALRFKYNWQDGAYNFEMGTDIGWVGNTGWYTFAEGTWGSEGAAGTNIDNLFGTFQGGGGGGQMYGAYPGINDCNRAVESFVNGKAQGAYQTDSKLAAERLSEVYINRAWWYYMLVTQLGDVYMTLKSSNSVPANYNFVKSSSEQIYRQLIRDVRYAYEHLEADATDIGRHTKYSAAHFLAKLYLQRAQGAQFKNSSETHLKMLYKGDVATDLDSCIFFATQVIDSKKYELQADYWGLFDVKKGDYSNERSKEIILAAGYGAHIGFADSRYGMRSQGYFTSTYTRPEWGIPGRTWVYGSNNTGFRPTDFAYDVFTNKIADSRFEKSFRIEYESMRTSGTAATDVDIPYYAYDHEDNATQTWGWTDADGNRHNEDLEYFNNNVLPFYDRTSWNGRQAKFGEHKIGAGDLGLVFLENTKSTAIELDKALGQPYLLFPRWIKTADGKYYYRKLPTDHYTSLNSGLDNSSLVSTTAASKKHIDPNRVGLSAEYGTRNVAMFRLAETYLIRAEAYGRRDGVASANAINDINTVRRRAAYKANENRAEVIARLYPGSENLAASERQWPYTVATDMSVAMEVDASYWDGSSDNSKAEKYPQANTTGMPDDLFRFVNFIHNEYAREMNSEYTYLETIHHAGTQADRIMYHFQLGAPATISVWDVADNVTPATGGTVLGQTGKGKGMFQPFHTFRPYPQKFMDMLTDENNVPLSSEAKQAYQNPGYK